MNRLLPLPALLAVAAAHAQLFEDQDSVLQIHDGKLDLRPVSAHSQPAAATALQLTLQPDGGEVIAHIREGNPVIVLLADRDGHYLAANQFGLTGWVQAAENPQEDEDDQLDALYGVAKSGFTLYYPPGAGEVLYGQETGEDSPTLYTLLRSQSGKDGGEYDVRCDTGMSGDPSCSFFAAADETREGTEENTLSGTTFYLPGNGHIYSSNRANDYFERRSKWALADGKISEIKQPYYYIGMASRVIADAEDPDKTLKLTTRPDGGDTVAELRPGEEIWLILETGKEQACGEEGCPRRQVLIEYGENEQFGWAQLDSGLRTMVEDFYYNGD